MTHCVARTPFICPKCKKENAGSSRHWGDYMVCVPCYDLYVKELEPTVMKMISDYFHLDKD